MRTNINELRYKETIIRFDKDETDNIGLIIQQADKTTNIYNDLVITSLFQIKKVGDKYPKGFSNGRTMINSESSANVKFVEQLFNEIENSVLITTFANDDNGNEYINYLEYDKEYDVLETWNEFNCKNKAGESIEFFPSITLEGISPYTDNSEKVELTKYRSQWTMEGKRDISTFADLQLEQCWKPSGVSVEKFGYTGSMPVNGYFPMASIYDSENNVAWSYQLHAKSSWQIEMYNKEKKSTISLGLPDRNFGDVMYKLNAGEKIITPKVRIAVTSGTVEDCNRKLTRYQNKAYNEVNKEEFPIIFNEFCSSWGAPDEDNVLKRASVASELGCDYFMIDAGWYNSPMENPDLTIGDWQVNKEKFPKGLSYIKDELSKLSLKLGIWFEFENCGQDSKIYNNEDYMLHRDNLVLETVKRRFFDFNNPDVIEYMNDKVDRLIKANEIDYVKIDYNDSIGYGVDHEQSGGLGVIEAIENNYKYFSSLVKNNKDVVFESCSSGGHRLTLPFVEITNMSSFSDAHETNGIPLVAANLSTLFLIKQMQIWAVLHPHYSKQKIAYLLASTFIGRMCISGTVEELDADQKVFIKQYVDYYKSLEDIIKNANCTVFRSHEGSYENPLGYQIVEFSKVDSNEGYLVIQTFDLENSEVTVDLSDYEVISSISYDDRKVDAIQKFSSNYDSLVIKVKRNG